MMNRKKITQKELEKFLKKHKLWLNNDPKGERANLHGANLRGADLCSADLYGADLYGADLCSTNLCSADLCSANLCSADLCSANLCSANLYGADLCSANLCSANLCSANLCSANLYGADLRGANLRGADLRGANLRGADLCSADLYGADLYGADLYGANLYGAENVNYPIACPEKGSFIGFKKAHGHIVELEICEDAMRCSATTRKCRCSKAKVLSITNYDGTVCELTSIPSDYDSDFVYTVGEIVEVKDFNTNRWTECSAGIHFFITRDEAVNY